MKNFRNKTGKILSVVMAALLMLSSMLIALPADSVAFAAAGTVTKTAHSDEYGREPYFTVTNPDHGTRNATCINFNAAAPDTGTAVGSPVLSNNDKLRRVLYYGNRGPADTGVYGWTFTSMAASSAMGNIPTKDGQSLGDHYELSAFKTYPVPPSTFKVYIVSTGKAGYQDLAYWTIETPPAPKYGALEVYKRSANESITNGNTCYSLEGCVIGLYKHGTNTEVGRFTTDANGYGGKIGNLTPGQYDIMELKAPKGLVLDQTIVTVTVEADKTTTYTLKDQPANDPVGLLLQKVDAGGNTSAVENGTFAGAQYTFEYFDGQYSEAELVGKTPLRTWVFATNEKGRIRLEDADKVSGDDFYTTINGTRCIPVGTLRVHETKTVTGYLVDPTMYIINIIAEEYTGALIKSYQPVTSPEQVIRGGVELSKIDSRTGKALEGVEFAVKDSAGTVVAILVTDANGYAATANNALVYGSYTLEETKSKAGYSLDSTPKSFEIVENGKMVSFTGDSSILNTQQPGYLEVVKTDEKTGKPLEGIEFTIYSDKDCTKAVQTITTDANGYAKSKSLTAGTYYVKETKPKKGYVMSAEVLEGKVTPNKETKIEITNKPVMLTIKLTKTDDKNGEGVSGAVYSLYARENIVTASGDVVHTAGSIVKDFPETDTNGSATLRNLYPGKYFIKEKTAPASGIYQLDTTEYDVVAAADESSPAVITANIEVKEKRAPGYLQIVKTDSATGEALEGVEFGIYNDKDCIKLVQTLVTDTAGKAKSKALSEGKYYIKETKAKEGYVMTAEVFEKSVTAAKTTTVKISNDFTKVEISKTSVTGSDELAGAEFVIRDVAGNEVATWTSETKPYSINRLPAGEYTLTEFRAPFGYQTAETITFIVQETGEIQKVEMKDSETYGKVIVNKTDAASGKPLAGIEYSIYRVDAISSGTHLEEDGSMNEPYVTYHGPKVATLVTDANGHAESKELPIGTYGTEGWTSYIHYVMIETNTIPGYVLDKEYYPIQFEYINDTTPVVTKTFDLTNDFTKLSIKKIDSETGNFVPDATLIIKDSDGNEIERWNSSKEAHLIERLPAGNYTLTELRTPFGYQVAETVEFTVVETSEVQIIEMKDAETFGKVIINKSDSSNGQPLKGVKFEVRVKNDVLDGAGNVTIKAGTVVDTLITDKTGHAESKELPIGTYGTEGWTSYIQYELQETQTLAGYVLDSKVYDVEFTYENDTTPVVVKSFDITNKSQTPPDTGDTSNILMLIAFAIISLVAGIIIIKKRVSIQ